MSRFKRIKKTSDVDGSWVAETTLDENGAWNIARTSYEEGELTAIYYGYDRNGNEVDTEDVDRCLFGTDNYTEEEKNSYYEYFCPDWYEKEGKTYVLHYICRPDVVVDTMLLEQLDGGGIPRRDSHFRLLWTEGCPWAGVNCQACHKTITIEPTVRMIACGGCRTRLGLYDNWFRNFKNVCDLSDEIDQEERCYQASHNNRESTMTPQSGVDPISRPRASSNLRPDTILWSEFADAEDDVWVAHSGEQSPEHNGLPPIIEEDEPETDTRESVNTPLHEVATEDSCTPGEELSADHVEQAESLLSAFWSKLKSLSPMEKLSDFVSKSIDWVLAFFPDNLCAFVRRMWNKVVAAVKYLTTGEAVSAMTNAMANWKEYRSHPCIQALHRASSYVFVLLTGCKESLVWKNIVILENVADEQRLNATSLVEGLVKSMWGIRKTVDGLSTGVWDELMVNKTTRAYIHEMMTVGKDMELYINGNQKDDEFSGAPDFLRHVEERYQIWKRHGDVVRGPLSNMYIHGLTKSYYLLGDLHQKVSGSTSMREAPFVFMLSGASGVGKSGVREELMRICIRAAGGDAGKGKICAHAPTSKHQQAMTTDKTGYFFDDMANCKVASATVTPEQEVFRAIAGNDPLSVEKADVESKAKVWYQPTCVAITTNIEYLQADLISNCPESLMRRIHYRIEIILDDKYKNSSGYLDSAKVAADFGTRALPDIWQFVVYRFVINPNSKTKVNGEWRPINRYRVSGLTKFLIDESLKFRKQQKALIARTSMDPGFCTSCTNHAEFCSCPEPTVIRGNEVYTPPLLVAHSGHKSLDDDLDFDRLVSDWYTNGVIATNAIAQLVQDCFVYGIRVALKALHRILRESGVLTPAFWTPSYLNNTPFGDRMMMHSYPGIVNKLSGLLTFERRFWSLCSTSLHALTISNFISKKPLGLIPIGQIVATYCATTQGPFERIIKSQAVQDWIITRNANPLAAKVNSHFWTTMVTSIPGIGILFAAKNLLLRLIEDSRPEVTRLMSVTHERAMKKICPDVIVAFRDKTMPNIFTAGFSYKVARSLYKHSWSEAHSGEIPLAEAAPIIYEDRRKRLIERTIAARSCIIPSIKMHNTIRLGTPTELANAIEHNLLSVDAVSRCGKEIFTKAIIVSPKLMMIHNHFWKEIADTFTLRFGPDFNSSGKKCCNAVINYRVSCVRTINKGNDLTFVYIPELSDRKDLTEHFPKSVIGDWTCGRIVSRSRDGNIVINQVGSITRDSFVYVGPDKNKIIEHGLTYDYPGQAGDCMSVILSNNTPSGILGFHTAGSSTQKCGAVTVCQDLIREVQEHFRNVLQAHLGYSGVRPTPNSGWDKVLADIPHYKSHVYDVIEDSGESDVRVLGAVLGRETLRSRTKKSPLHDDVRDLLISRGMVPEDMVYRPAALKGPNGRDPSWGFSSNLKKNQGGSTGFPNKDVDKAVSCKLQSLLTVAGGSRDLSVLRRIPSVDEIINGIPGNPYVRGIKMSTSAGFNWPGGKKAWFIEDEPGHYVMCPELQADYDSRIAAYKNGESTQPIFKAIAKDEVLDKDKVRLVYAAQISYYLLQCQVTAPFVSLLMAHPLESESFVGMSEQSSDWEKSKKKIFHFGEDRGLFSDFSRFDLTQSVGLIEESYKIAAAVTSVLCPDFDRDYYMNIVAEIFTPIVLIDGVVLRMVGLHPSGLFDNTYMNSLYGSLVYRCCFYSLYPTLRYPEYVSCVHNGDDVAGSASKKVPCFNNLTLMDYVNQYGMIITPPVKEGVKPRKFYHINDPECMFLSRRFVYDSEFQRHRAPLKPGSLLKMLTWTATGGDAVEKHVSTLISFRYEMVQQGRYNFDRIVPEVMDIARKHGFEIPGGDMSFDELLEIVLSEQLSPAVPIPDYMVRHNSLALEAHSGESVEENVRFTEEPDETVVVEDPPRSHPDAAVSQTDLAEFLKRPVKIFDQTWSTLSAFSELIYPMSNVVANPRTINRINHYRGLRGDLHLRFVINGNPFLSGRLIAAFWPTELVCQSRPETITGLPKVWADNVRLSQLQHILLDPTTDKGGDMIIPYQYPREYLDLHNKNYLDTDGIARDDTLVYGTLFIRELNELRHVTEDVSTITNAHVTIYGWLENVEFLSGTMHDSVLLTAQSGVLDKAAKVTHLVGDGLSAGSKVAAALGYSRSDQRGDSTVCIRTTGRLARAEDADDSDETRLIGPSRLGVRQCDLGGVGPPDPLTFKSFCSIPSILDTFQWIREDNPDDVLASWLVDPAAHLTYVGRKTRVEHHLTPLAFASQFYAKWRGSMTYRIQIVASAVHKGRIALVYDSYTAASGISTKENTGFVKIIDIAETREFTITVGWNQPELLLSRSDVTSEDVDKWFKRDTAFTVHSGNANGVLTMYVVNPLSTPNVSLTNDTRININVWVHSDDIEFCDPDAPYMILTAHSGTTEVDAAVAKEVVPDYSFNDSIPQFDYSDAVGGERVLSLRPMLLRYTPNYFTMLQKTGTTTRTMFQSLISSIPQSTGFVTGATTNGIDPVLVGVDPYNPSPIHPFSLICHCFAGHRGGFKWKIITQTYTPSASSAHVVLNRVDDKGLGIVIPRNPVVISDSTTDPGFMYKYGMNSLRGSALQVTTSYHQTNQGPSIKSPDYRAIRYDIGESIDQADKPSSQAIVIHTKLETGSTAYIATQIGWCACDNDTAFTQFIGIPIHYGPPAPYDLHY